MRTRIAVTWIAFLSATILALPQPPDPLPVLVSAVAGAIVIAIGFKCAAQTRPLSARPALQRLVLGSFSLLAGAVVGAILLGALVVLARAEPALRARFVNRLSEPWWRPWALAYESSILEEVVFRLAILTVVAWIALRVTKRPRLAFGTGLLVSTIAFAAAHLPAWIAVTQPAPALIAGVMLLNGVGAILFAFLFWRWGLPYAIVAHFAGDVVVQTLGPRLLA